MATYKYQLNLDRGVNYGYVKYNISPDFGESVAPGEVITISGESYSKDAVYVELSVMTTMVNNRGRVLGKVTQPFAKGAVVPFEITFVMPQAVVSLFNPETRLFSVPILFGWVNADNTGEFTQSDSAQAISTLKYRLSPSIVEADLGRFALKNGAYVRSDEGTHVVVRKLKATISTAASVSDIKNCYFTYINDEGQAQKIQLDVETILNGYQETVPGIFSEKSFSAGKDYALTLVVGDDYATDTLTFTLFRAFCNLHLAGCGKGVAMGQFSSSTDSNPMLECQYPAHFYDTIHLHGTPATDAFAAITMSGVGRSHTGGTMFYLERWTINKMEANDAFVPWKLSTLASDEYNGVQILKSGWYQTNVLQHFMLSKLANVRLGLYRFPAESPPVGDVAYTVLDTSMGPENGFYTYTPSATSATYINQASYLFYCDVGDILVQYTTVSATATNVTTNFQRPRFTINRVG